MDCSQNRNTFKEGNFATRLEKETYRGRLNSNGGLKQFRKSIQYRLFASFFSPDRSRGNYF